jgi:hypothetical protein
MPTRKFKKKEFLQQESLLFYLNENFYLCHAVISTRNNLKAAKMPLSAQNQAHNSESKLFINAAPVFEASKKLCCK